MSGQVSFFGRLTIRLGTPLLLLAGFAVIWAVWHVVAGQAFGPTLLIYADSAREPMRPSTDRLTICAKSAP